MTGAIFDEQAQWLRRRRAERLGGEHFLHEHAFDDILERLALVRRAFDKALVVGHLDERLRERVGSIDVIEAAGVMQAPPHSYDLCITVGALDAVNDLPQVLLAIRFALRPESLLLGAVLGGDSLPTLRAAMRAADERMGAATPHVHPALAPASLAGLLQEAGFTMPVVDVDRVLVSYANLAGLVKDLRRMGATNTLAARSRKPLSRAATAAAAEHFASRAQEGRVTERFELLHFAAWTPPSNEG